MKKLFLWASFVVLTLTVATFGQTNGLIGGIASVDGKPLTNITVRLRNIDNGQLVRNTTANTAGEFTFNGLSPGNYIAEMVSANGTIVGTSVAITLTAAAMVSTNITVGASAAALAASGTGVAAGAVIGATGAATTGVAAGLSATAIAVSAVGVTLGTTAVVAIANDASPSR